MNSSPSKNESVLLMMYPLQHRSPAEVMIETFIGCVLFVLGLTGNGLVCYVIHKKRFTNSSMYFFMLNLAYADLLVCFVSIPLTLLSTRPQPLGVQFGSVPCKIIRFIQYILPPASVAILTATAIDRYFHLCVPLKKMITTRATKQLAAICWGSAFILTLPIFFLIETQKVIYNGFVYEFCNIEETSTYPTAGMIYLVFRGCLGFAIPLAMVSVLYSRIVRTVWQRRSRHRSANRQRANVVKSLLTVVIAFSLSWAPFSICNKYYLFMKPNREVITRQEIICFWIGLTASVYNPLIYAFYNKKFRNAFVSVVLKKKQPHMTLNPVQLSHRPRSKTLPAVLALEGAEQQPQGQPQGHAQSIVRGKKTRHLSLAFDILEEKGPRCSNYLFGGINPFYHEAENAVARNEQCILQSKDKHVIQADVPEPAVTRNSACAKEKSVAEEVVFTSRVVKVEPRRDREPLRYPTVLKRSQTLSSPTNRIDAAYYEKDNTASMQERKLDLLKNRKFSRSNSMHFPSSYNLCNVSNTPATIINTASQLKKN